MKINIKLLLTDCLIAIIVILIGLTISKTFICGMFCGVLYYFITDLIKLYFKEGEEK